MFEYINVLLGIIASVLVIAGTFAGSRIIKKRNSVKNSENGIVNNSSGDATNVSGSSVAVQGGYSIIGNNNTFNNQAGNEPSGNEKPYDVIDLKATCRILFIDDDKVSCIGPLRKSGWKNIKKIGDTANLDMQDIRLANIVFVDILGVGKILEFENEGIGLAAAIKRKYPEKGVVIYSATPEHKIFDPDLDILDGRLDKNAEPIQFSNKIEQYGKPKN